MTVPPDTAKAEYRTRQVPREILYAELDAFCADWMSRGHTDAVLRFGWDSELEFRDMWKPHVVPINQVVTHVRDAEAKGIATVGVSDVIVAVADVELTLCHESDLHLKGVGAFVEAITARWSQLGLEPSKVETVYFKWPGTGRDVV